MVIGRKRGRTAATTISDAGHVISTKYHREGLHSIKLLQALRKTPRNSLETILYFWVREG